MARKKALGLLSLSLIGMGLYAFRRQIAARWLGLSPHGYKVRVKSGLRIPMPDGVLLAADHYSPKAKGLFPTILIRTPYGRSVSIGLPGILASFIAQRFAERGYNVIVQDVRGRFESQGEFVPFVNEAEDGRATLTWLENQPWFNGVLGMWGPSYLGYTQWAVARDGPLYLKAIVPAASASLLPLAIVRSGSIALETFLRWLWIVDAMDRRGARSQMLGAFRFSPIVAERMLERTFNHLPVGEVDRLIMGKPEPFFQAMLNHPNIHDEFWQRLNFRVRIPHVTASAHFISGWYDFFLYDTLADYQRMRQSGRNPYLTVGPWSHLDLEMEWEALRHGLVWFEAILKGDRTALRSKPVRYFLMGGGGWQEIDDWPPPTEERRLYLGKLDNGNGTLSLDMPATPSEPSVYDYDPQKPTPNLGGPLLSANSGPKDNRELENRPDVLTFTSDVLEQHLDVVGAVRLILYVNSSLKITDFFGRLCEVYPDGRSINVCDGLIRLKKGVGKELPDGSRQVELELSATAKRFAQGNCIRLQISSGAHPRWNRNLGTNEPILTATQFVVAHQTIYHDRDHPAALFLPVFKAS